MLKDQPFTTVNDHDFKTIIYLLRADSIIPSADTIKRNIMRTYKDKKNDLCNILQVSVYSFQYFAKTFTTHF